MGYRDDFYCAENVVGYTGSLQDFPSVYFLTKKEFGHITQKHDSPQNVGRNAVFDAKGYRIGNYRDKKTGDVRMHEMMDGYSFHESRGTLTRTKNMSDGDKAVLVQAIWKCKDEKQISIFDKKTVAKIDATEKQHKKVMAELLDEMMPALTAVDL